jgi:uracil-DNA glycosylase family 4
MPNYVAGVGRSSAKLVVVGEAPGANEDEQREPFVGVTGRDLNDFLKEGGSSRGECWLTNVVKYRPPNNDFRRLGEVKTESGRVLTLTDSHQQLWVELDSLKEKNCILCLGEQALHAVTGKSGISHWRGSILTALDGKTKVIATYHPARLYKSTEESQVAYQWRYIIGFDISRAVKQSRFPEIDLPNRDLRIARSSSDVYRFINNGIDRGPVSVDIEAINCIPVCIGLSFDYKSALSIPLFAKIGNLRVEGVGESELVYIWRDINEALKSKYGAIGQNFKYDEDKISRLGFRTRKLYGDTLLLGHALNPEYPSKKLEFFTSIYTEEPYYKEEGKEFSLKKDKIDRLLLYNARDAAVTKEIHDKMLLELDEYSKEFNVDFRTWYHEFVCELHPFYLRIEQTGLLRDKAVQAKLRKKYQEMWLERQIKFEQRVGFDGKIELTDKGKLEGSVLNVASPPAMSSLIFEKMKLPFRKGKNKKAKIQKTKEEEDEQGATGEAVIASLMTTKKVTDAQKLVLQDILDIRKIRKTIGTYIDCKEDYDGRVKTSYNIVGTETGRTSTRNIKGPPVRPEKMGSAFQTLTKHGELGADIRLQYIPDSGYVFLEIDQSQAEDRVVTLLCNDIKGLDEFKTVDKHWQVASWIFSDVTSEWQFKSYRGTDRPPKSDGRRFIGKKGRHGSNYDMGAKECSIQVNKEAQKFGLPIRISEWKAQQILDTVHTRKPEIRGVYHREIQEAINFNRTLIGPSIYGIPGGRRRQFLDRLERGLFKEAYAYIPQATVSDNTKAAGMRVEKVINDRRVLRFCIEGHDSLTALVLKSEVFNVGKVLKEEFERPMNFKQCTLSRDYDLVIPCEMEIGEKNLRDMEKFEP